MRSPADDAEFDRAAAVAGFLHDAGLGGARILTVDEPRRTLLMEDVGEERLVDAARAAGPDDPRTADLYRAVVDHLLRLQEATERAGRECPLAVDRTLDRAQLAWETGYFAGNFLAQLCGSSREDELAGEFAVLNGTVAAQPLVLVHRDFQAENIVTGSGRVRLVDVQGMRLGPLGYDAASVLWDPYVDLPRRLRDELVDRFARGAAAAHDLATETVVDMVHTAALQRLMQALGAYAYLGAVKGRRGFLAHRARGLAHLRQALDRSSLNLPRLRAVLGELPPL
jgi:aminoglycoside/choline kinase family phosphotransferase